MYRFAIILLAVLAAVNAQRCAEEYAEKQKEYEQKASARGGIRSLGFRFPKCDDEGNYKLVQCVGSMYEI